MCRILRTIFEQCTHPEKKDVRCDKRKGKSGLCFDTHWRPEGRISLGLCTAYKDEKDHQPRDQRPADGEAEHKNTILKQANDFDVKHTSGESSQVKQVEEVTREAQISRKPAIAYRKENRRSTNREEEAVRSLRVGPEKLRYRTQTEEILAGSNEQSRGSPERNQAEAHDVWRALESDRFSNLIVDSIERIERVNLKRIDGHASVNSSRSHSPYYTIVGDVSPHRAGTISSTSQALGIRPRDHGRSRYTETYPKTRTRESSRGEEGDREENPDALVRYSRPTEHGRHSGSRHDSRGRRVSNSPSRSRSKNSSSSQGRATRPKPTSQRRVRSSSEPREYESSSDEEWSPVAFREHHRKTRRPEPQRHRDPRHRGQISWSRGDTTRRERRPRNSYPSPRL